MNHIHVKTGDTVVMLSGKDKGKQGKVLQVSPKEQKVIVEGLNMVTKHVKPRKQGDPAGIMKAESAVYACKVMAVCPKCGKATRPIRSRATPRPVCASTAAHLIKKEDNHGTFERILQE